MAYLLHDGKKERRMEGKKEEGRKEGMEERKTQVGTQWFGEWNAELQDLDLILKEALM